MMSWLFRPFCPSFFLFNTNDLLSLPFEDAHEKLCITVHSVLSTSNKDELGLSSQIIAGLLLDDDDDDDEKDEFNEEEEAFFVVGKNRIDDVLKDGETLPIFKGFSYCRPLYRELTRRILLLTKWYHQHHGQQKQQQQQPINDTNKDSLFIRMKCRPLINAKQFGFTEINNDTQSNIYLLLSSSCKKHQRKKSLLSTSSITAWFKLMGDDGIMEILGMRQTIGTVKECYFPPKLPSVAKLVQSSRKPCKPNAKPPLLSVAARARSKHAHRGSQDQYFGVAKGSTHTLNERADGIVKTMIQNAVWINIHTFGGTSSIPVLEIRVENGYGVRWSTEKTNNSNNEDTVENNNNSILFRGFLEPQMEDGFEKQWRH